MTARDTRRGVVWMMKCSPTFNAFRFALVRAFAGTRTPESDLRTRRPLLTGWP